MSYLSDLDFLEQMGDYPRPFSRLDVGDDDDDDDEEDGNFIPKIRIGICAMSKKVTCRVKLKMKVILQMLKHCLNRKRIENLCKIHTSFIDFP